MVQKNGSWTYSDIALNKLQYNKYDDTGGLPLYYDENDQYSPGNVFNSGVYDIIVKSGKSLGTLLTETIEGTALDDYLLDYIVGSDSTGDIDRNQNSPVNTASYSLSSAQIQTYAGIPGLTYKGGNRAYDGGWIFTTYMLHSHWSMRMTILITAHRHQMDTRIQLTRTDQKYRP